MTCRPTAAAQYAPSNFALRVDYWITLQNSCVKSLLLADVVLSTNLIRSDWRWP